MQIGFDIISDLNLSPESTFDWEGKATSLYCIVAGNVSTDLNKVIEVLSNLSNFYQGIFFVPGAMEYHGISNIEVRTRDIVKACKKVKNVAVLYQHVVIIDGVAVLGCNGWSGNTVCSDDITNLKVRSLQLEDLTYLKLSLEKLQRHLDVTKIILVTNSVPDHTLYFGENPDRIQEQIPLNVVLMADTMNKVTHWVFGTHKKIVDTVKNNINYVNNPCYDISPYWAKRIDVTI